MGCAIGCPAPLRRYPLGRPVGTTIYPGMQITSVAIHDTLKALGPQYVKVEP